MYHPARSRLALTLRRRKRSIKNDLDIRSDQILALTFPAWRSAPRIRRPSAKGDPLMRSGQPQRGAGSQCSSATAAGNRVFSFVGPHTQGRATAAVSHCLGLFGVVRALEGGFSKAERRIPSPHDLFLGQQTNVPRRVGDVAIFSVSRLQQPCSAEMPTAPVPRRRIYKRRTL